MTSTILTVSDAGPGTVPMSKKDLRAAYKNATAKGKPKWLRPAPKPKPKVLSLRQYCRALRRGSAALPDNTYRFWDPVTPIPCMTPAQIKAALGREARRLSA